MSRRSPNLVPSNNPALAEAVSSILVRSRAARIVNTTAVLAFGTSAALAQTTPATGQASAASSSESSLIEEIVVTAQRRESTLESIPYSISAISGDALAATGTTNLAGLANQMPGFAMQDRGRRFAGTDVPIIRGLNGSATDRPGTVFEQMPVGTYLGNSPVTGYFPIADVERIEVLRGPQGTLYGAGALGGAIRTIPVDPKLNQWAGEVSIEGRSLAHSSGKGYVASGLLNAPIGSIAAFRASAQYDYQPGFITQYGVQQRQGANYITDAPALANPGDVANSPSIYYTAKDANYTKVKSGRASLLIEPNDKFNVQLAYNVTKLNGINGPQDNPTYSGGPSFFDPRITLPASGEYESVGSTLQPYDRESHLGSLDLSYDAGFATLASTSTYYTTEGYTGTDNTVSVVVLPSTYLAYYIGNPVNPRWVGTFGFTDHTRTFTQEVRLISKGHQTIDYVVGAFYEHERRGQTWDIYEPGSRTQTEATGGVLVNTDALGRSLTYTAPSTFEEKAIFGEATWNISDRWQATAGARFFKQDFRQTERVDVPLFAQTFEADTPASANDHIFKVDTTYEYADGQHVYATYSQGFRRGGANAFPLSGFYREPAEILQYVPDKANNFEVGFKGVFSNGARYSADVFYIDWKKPQIGVYTPVNLWPVVINGSKAKSKGFEGEAHFPLFNPNVRLTLGYAYVNAKLTEDFCLPAGDGTGVPDSNVPCGVFGSAGQTLPGTPKNSATATLTYTQHWGASRKITYVLNGSYKSAVLNALPNAAINAIYNPSYTLANASITWNEGDNWTFALSGRNIFDRRAVLGSPLRSWPLIGNLGNAYTINTPREVGLRVSYQF